MLQCGDKLFFKTKCGLIFVLNVLRLRWCVWDMGGYYSMCFEIGYDLCDLVLTPDQIRLRLNLQWIYWGTWWVYGLVDMALTPGQVERVVQCGFWICCRVPNIPRSEGAFMVCAGKFQTSSTEFAWNKGHTVPRRILSYGFTGMYIYSHCCGRKTWLTKYNLSY